MREKTNPHIPSRKRRWVWILLMAGVAIVGGLSCYRAMLARKIDARLDQIRQAGYPATSVELDRWHQSVPIQENAALKVLEAGDARTTSLPKIADQEWPGRAEPLKPELKYSLKQTLDGNARALEILHRGVQLSTSRYPVNLAAGPETLLPHLATVKSLAQLLSAEALLATEDGKPEQAVQSVNDTLKLARTLATEPIFVSQLVRMDCARIACSGLERLLNGPALTDEQLATLLANFEETDAGIQQAFTRAFIGERCLGSHVFRMPLRRWAQFISTDSSANAGPMDGFPVFYYALQWAGVGNRDFLFYLAIMDDWIEASQRPFPECLIRARQTTERFKVEIQQHRFFLLSKMLVPALQGLVEKVAEGNARLRCAQVALAIERHRLRHNGQLPEGLNRLVPTFLAHLANDPWDGQPLRYKPLKTGYVIYSIGKDGKDDGGLEPPKKSGASKPADVTFTIER